MSLSVQTRIASLNTAVNSGEVGKGKKVLSSKYNLIEKHGKFSDLLRRIVSIFMPGMKHLEQTSDKTLLNQTKKIIRQCNKEELANLKAAFKNYQDQILLPERARNAALQAADAAKKLNKADDKQEAPASKPAVSNQEKMLNDIFAAIAEKEGQLPGGAPKPEKQPSKEKSEKPEQEKQPENNGTTGNPGTEQKQEIPGDLPPPFSEEAIVVDADGMKIPGLENIPSFPEDSATPIEVKGPLLVDKVPRDQKIADLSKPFEVQK